MSNCNLDKSTQKESTAQSNLADASTSSRSSAINTTKDSLDDPQASHQDPQAKIQDLIIRFPKLITEILSEMYFSTPETEELNSAKSDLEKENKDPKETLFKAVHSILKFIKLLESPGDRIKVLELCLEVHEQFPDTELKKAIFEGVAIDGALSAQSEVERIGEQELKRRNDEVNLLIQERLKALNEAAEKEGE